MLNEFKEFNQVQQFTVIEKIVNFVTKAVVISVLYRCMLEAYGGDGVVLKHYVEPVLGSLVLIKVIYVFVSERPRLSFTIYYIADIVGLGLLVIYTSLYNEPMLVAMDVVLCSIAYSLTKPHKEYMRSIVVNKSKAFSAYLGRVDIYGGLLFSAIGGAIVYLEIDLILLSVIGLALQLISRVWTMRIVNVVYK